jgi:hypothetical protein
MRRFAFTSRDELPAAGVTLTEIDEPAAGDDRPDVRCYAVVEYGRRWFVVRTGGGLISTLESGKPGGYAVDLAELVDGWDRDIDRVPLQWLTCYRHFATRE